MRQRAFDFFGDDANSTASATSCRWRSTDVDQICIIMSECIIAVAELEGSKVPVAVADPTPTAKETKSE